MNFFKKLTLLVFLLAQHKVLTHQLAYTQHNQPGGIGSHITPLLMAIAHTEGPILELGCGDFSTPQIHAICSKSKRLILSTDTSKEWLEKFNYLKSEWHLFEYVPVYENDWDKNAKPNMWDKVGNNIHWSIVLVDHRPGERRIVDIDRLRSHTDIFVVHDTEPYGAADYKFEPIFKTFKYRINYTYFHPHTTILSDTIDIINLFNK